MGINLYLFAFKLANNNSTETHNFIGDGTRNFQCKLILKGLLYENFIIIEEYAKLLNVWFVIRSCENNVAIELGS